MPAGSRYKGSRGNTRQMVNAVCRNICNSSHVERHNNELNDWAERAARKATDDDVQEYMRQRKLNLAKKDERHANV